MSFRLGLTGSIGMGKSTTAQMFRDLGLPVWDADQAVHGLYSPGQAAAVAVGRAYPSAMRPDGSVDRPALRKLIAQDPSVLDRLNAIVHPLVAADRAHFLLKNKDFDIVVLDLPLLFETGAGAICDAVLVVSAPADVQKQRVLARGMSQTDFDIIQSRQMPDAEKRSKADYIIETVSLDATRGAVQDLVTALRERLRHA